jgi:hypothetical protein
MGSAANALMVLAGLFDELDAHADPMESLPQTHVEPELHARLLLVDVVGQLDDDASILGRFRAAPVSTHKRCEIPFNPGFARPQLNGH